MEEDNECYSETELGELDGNASDTSTVVTEDTTSLKSGFSDNLQQLNSIYDKKEIKIKSEGTEEFAKQLGRIATQYKKQVAKVPFELTN